MDKCQALAGTTFSSALPFRAGLGITVTEFVTQRKGYTMEADNTETGNTTADKVKDENAAKSPEPQPNVIWKVSSGLYNMGSGAVGMGVSGLKWAASTTYNVGSGVVSATQNVISKTGIPVAKPKPKNKKE